MTVASRGYESGPERVKPPSPPKSAGPGADLSTLAEQVEHAVRQIDHALEEGRINDMGALWLTTIRGTLTGAYLDDDAQRAASSPAGEVR